MVEHLLPTSALIDPLSSVVELDVTGDGDGVTWLVNLPTGEAYEMWMVLHNASAGVDAKYGYSPKVETFVLEGHNQDCEKLGLDPVGGEGPTSTLAAWALPTTTAGGTSTASSSTVSNSTPSSSPVESHPPVSVTAPPSRSEPSHEKALIAAGSCVGALILIVILSTALWRRRRRMKSRLQPFPAPAAPESSPARAKAELARALMKDPGEGGAASASSNEEAEIERLRAAVAQLEEEAREWRVGELETLPSYDSRSV
ncbi:hypothetical protein EXIGLDRAFT_732786, partial [Exidia glandulosa HHB12029]